VIETLQWTAMSLAWLAAIFIPLEWAFPAWPRQARRRLGLAADLGFFLGQYLLWSALAVACLSLVARGLTLVPGIMEIRATFAELPTLVALAIVVVAGDFVAYWMHRLQHRSELLWRFHAVHHTAERLDFLAAHREHPLDGIYTQLWINLPAMVLGIPIEQVFGLVVFRGVWAVFIHANVRLPLGPLGMMFGDPALHHWHHAKDRHVGNYANLAPYLDWLFGTHHRPEHEPGELGIHESHPRGYLALLSWPFRAGTRRASSPADRRPR
jgi:sterol desaturase/sphingolipid hydroxylase (fatty acid hydroxylase superfamily)